jgi:hypothetical protein
VIEIVAPQVALVQLIPSTAPRLSPSPSLQSCTTICQHHHQLNCVLFTQKTQIVHPWQPRTLTPPQYTNTARLRRSPVHRHRHQYTNTAHVRCPPTQPSCTWRPSSPRSEAKSMGAREGKTGSQDLAGTCLLNSVAGPSIRCSLLRRFAAKAPNTIAASGWVKEREYPTSITKGAMLSMGSGMRYRLGHFLDKQCFAEPISGLGLSIGLGLEEVLGHYKA